MSKKTSFKNPWKKNAKTLEQTIKENLMRQHSLGIAQGAYAMCQVVLEMAQKNEVSAEQRLQNIVRFCSACTKPPVPQKEDTAE